MQLIEGPAVVIGPAEADGLAALLEHGRRWARAQGIQLSPELAALVQAIDHLAIGRRRQEAAQFRSSDDGIPQETGSAKVLSVHGAAVALRLGCSPRWVRVLAQRGRLPGRKAGGQWVFSAADVETYAARRTEIS